MKAPNHNIRRAVIDGLVWGIGGKTALIIGNFLVLMVTSRTLSAVEFGVFAAAMVFSDLSWALATSAFGVALVQKHALSDEETSAGFVAFLSVALVVALVMAAGAGAFEVLFKAPGLTPVLWAMAAASAVKVMTGYYGALLQRSLDLRFYQLSQNLPQLIGGCLLTVLGALAGWGVWALVAGYALTAGMEFAMTAWRAKAPHRLPASWDAFAGLLHVGGATVVNRMANFLATSIDRVIVGAVLGPAALGIYTRAYSLMMVPVKLLGLTFQRTFLPVFSRLQDDEARLGATLQRVLTVQPVVFLPVGVGLTVAAPLLVSIVLGEGWSEVVLPAQILMGALGARLGYVAPEMAALAIGEASGAAKRQVVYAVLVVGGAALGLALGLAGVAMGVTASLTIFYVLSLQRAVHRLDCSPRPILGGHLRGILVAALALLIAFSVRTVVAPWVSPPQSIWVETSVYAAAVAALLLFAPARVLGLAVAELRADLLSTALRLLLPKRPTLQGPTP